MEGTARMLAVLSTGLSVGLVPACATAHAVGAASVEPAAPAPTPATELVELPGVPALPPAPAGNDAAAAELLLNTAAAELTALRDLEIEASSVEEALAQIRAGFSRTRTVNDAFGDVLRLDAHEDQTLAALTGEGDAWDVLAGALLGAEVTVAPSGVVPIPLHPAPARGHADAAAQMSEALLRAFDPWARAVECVAIHRYALASAYARTRLLSSDASRHAADRLASYGEERVSECLDVVRRGDTEHGIAADPTLPRFPRGFFYRAPTGLTAFAPTGASPPFDQAE